MSLIDVTGDLFALELPAIGQGCNVFGKMGHGIAFEFRRRWPAMYAEYAALCAAGDYALGDIHVWEAPGGQVLFNLATQNRPGKDARLTAVDESVRAALVECEARGIKQLGLPRVGAGIGGLDWTDVHEALEAAADDHPAVEIVVVSLPGA